MASNVDGLRVVVVNYDEYDEGEDCVGDRNVEKLEEWDSVDPEGCLRLISKHLSPPSLLVTELVGESS